MPVGLLKFLFGRTALRSASMKHAEGFLRESLKEMSSDAAAQFSEAAVRAILEEAARRAGEKEKDGIPRAAPFLVEVERAAKEAVKIVAGGESADSRIRTILEFHRTI